MRVLKFGGTSVGSPEGRDNICFLATEGTEDCIVVVSALSGVTDSLIALGREALGGARKNIEETLGFLSHRHLEAVDLSTPPQHKDALISFCTERLTELGSLVYSICEKREHGKDITATEQAVFEAEVVSYGEKLSSKILWSMIEGAVHIDSTEIIKTTPYFNRHIVDFPVTNSLIRERLQSSGDRGVTVMGGFISSQSSNNETTNLGRGGSDYTAAIVAAALRVSTLYIYTDVDGFLSCDPRIVPNAVLIEELGFVEAMELCNFGAKVVYPPTISPAYNANIPIVIRSTYNHTCKGTTIKNRSSLSSTSDVFKGISSINDTALLTLKGLRFEGLIGVNYRIFKALGRAGVSVFMASESSSEECTHIAIRSSDTELAVGVLCEEFAVEISRGDISEPSVVRNLAIVAIVGSSLEDNLEARAEIFGILERSGISIITYGYGGAHRSLAFVTDLCSMRRATEALHLALFSRHYDELSLFVGGRGALADSLVALVEGERRRVLERYGVRLCIEGVGIEDTGDIDFSAYNCPVFVDCGIESRGEGLYADLLSRGVRVVSGNLAGAVSEDFSGEDILGLYKYGGCVGEGLPMVRVLDDLARSGDTLCSLEGALSGVINYALSLYGRGLRFSVAMSTALNNYYGLVDSAYELSGRGVCERVGLLLRSFGVSGYLIECESLSYSDEEWESKREGLAEGGCYMYIARYSDGVLRVGLEIISDEDLYYNYEGYGVGISVYTNRYRLYPLQVRSFGDSNLGGVVESIFTDILSIAEIELR